MDRVPEYAQQMDWAESLRLPSRQTVLLLMLIRRARFDRLKLDVAEMSRRTRFDVGEIESFVVWLVKQGLVRHDAESGDLLLVKGMLSRPHQLNLGEHALLRRIESIRNISPAAQLLLEKLIIHQHYDWASGEFQFTWTNLQSIMPGTRRSTIEKRLSQVIQRGILRRIAIGYRNEPSRYTLHLPATSEGETAPNMAASGGSILIGEVKKVVSSSVYTDTPTTTLPPSLGALSALARDLALNLVETAEERRLVVRPDAYRQLARGFEELISSESEALARDVAERCRDVLEDREVRSIAPILRDGWRDVVDLSRAKMRRDAERHEREREREIAVQQALKRRDSAGAEARELAEADETMPEGSHPQAIWEVALGHLRMEVDKQVYETFLKETIGLAHANGEFVVGASDYFSAEMLEQRMYTLIAQTIESVIGEEVEVHFTIENRDPR